MRYVKLLVFVSAFLLILSSCDIVDSIFGSGDDDVNDPGGNGTIPISTLVIGPSGGDITLDSIIVNIPANAFNEDNEISVSVEDGTVEFDEYTNSELYQIEGLPNAINKPIRFNIKYRKTIEGDPLVSIGHMKYATSLDSTLYSYHTDDASDSSGYLVYNLPVYSNLAKISQEKLGVADDAMKLIALFGYEKLLSSDFNFIVSYPLIYKQQSITVAEYFEDAYKKCLSMGFSYSARLWPVDVLIKKIPRYDGLYWHKGNSTMTDDILQSWIDDGEFTINSDLFSDDTEMKATVGHEFLHLVQNLYEFSPPWIEPEQKWLQEATSTWIEEKFVNTSNYISSVHTNKEKYPFLGWQYTSHPDFTHAVIGYGLSPIIKDIADTYGDGAIIKIFEKIKSGILPYNAIDPVDAVLSVINEPVEYFWHRVLASYTLGNYYNNQVNFRLLDNPGNYLRSFTIDSTNNKHSVTAEYPDLSGDLFKVSAGDISRLKRAPLTIIVNDPNNCGILVCKYKEGSEITQIGEVYPGGTGQIILDDVKTIFDAGYELVVMVSNSTHDKNYNYKGINEVKLDIELLIEPEKPVLDDIDVYWRLTDVEKKATFDDGTITHNTQDESNGYITTGKGTSTFKNDVHSTVWNNVPYGSDALLNGDMTVTFLDNYQNLNVHINYVYTVISSGKTAVTTINFQGLPLTSSEFSEGTYGYLVNSYEVFGSDVCGLSYHYIQNDPGNGIFEDTGFGCGATAEFQVRMHHLWVDE